ncbi:MAG: hypothetical protein LIP04_05225 [Tannerellaceae bacterium]|nr:hypothetical protein [Tannerellaceae bacterium]
MNIWFYENETMAKEEAKVLPVLLKDIQASYVKNNENVWSIMNGKYPICSSDTGVERWTSWPQRETAQQIEFIFDQPTDVKAFSVYWYEDENGRVRLPEKWHLEYKDKAGNWKTFPLYSTDSYSILKDQFNLVHSDGDAFLIEHLRLHIQPKEDSAAGILQVLIDSKN